MEDQMAKNLAARFASDQHAVISPHCFWAPVIDVPFTAL